MPRFNYILLFFSVIVYLIFISGCNPGAEQSASTGNTASDDVKFQQYLVGGQQLYSRHCGNCHLEDGKGLARLYPPLAGSDFMLENLPRTLCSIKTGLEGEIIVNGIGYNMKMPANSSLTNIDIAEIATYIYNSWGNQYGLIEVKKVSDLLENCQP